MDETGPPTPRLAGVADARILGELLHAFNTEFETSTPEVAILADRLERYLPAGGLAALLIGQPASGFALVSFRPNVWYDAPIALLDELYVQPDLRNRRLGTALLDAVCALATEHGAEVVEINVDGDDVDARRFYEARGFSNTEPGRTDQLLYYYREL
ncbi:MAG TPA: GNAT family N-acetyltransferase [Frankiaceae bacterium]|nr:GNAT family N-acetyltransferase [Frankiaceae bacterium]